MMIMMIRLRTMCVCLSFVLAVACASAQDKPIALTGARIITAAGPEIDRGTLILHRGKIDAVGPQDTTHIPPDAQVIDVTGKVLMPGLVDTHNHIGGVGAADGSGPIQAGVRVLDSINPWDSGFRRAVAGGLTTINLMPGSGHLLSGQTIYVKPRTFGADGAPARTVEQMFIRDKAGMPMGGIKMANGTNPMRPPPFAATRGKAAALVREQFIRAKEYAEKMAQAGADVAKRPARDLALEALAEVIAGRTMVHHHTHRSDDIMTVLRLKKEFGFRVVLHHVSEAWKVADEIAAAGVPCSVILVDSPGGKLEASELSYETGAVLEKAGVKVAFHTDDWITDARLFMRMAALGVRAGMSREGAIKALTIHGAEMMDLGERVGSLAPGKDGDVLVLSGDPFSVYTKVEQTWIEGRKVFDLADPDDRLHAVGGFGAGRDQNPYFCCFGQ